MVAGSSRLKPEVVSTQSRHETSYSQFLTMMREERQAAERRRARCVRDFFCILFIAWFVGLWVYAKAQDAANAEAAREYVQEVISAGTR